MSEKEGPVEELRRWIKAVDGRTQQSLADLVGVRLGTVWRWLHGKTKPTLDAAAKLERELGIPMASWADEHVPTEDGEVTDGGDAAA